MKKICFALTAALTIGLFAPASFAKPMKTKEVKVPVYKGGKIDRWVKVTTLTSGLEELKSNDLKSDNLKGNRLRSNALKSDRFKRSR